MSSESEASGSTGRTQAALTGRGKRPGRRMLPEHGAPKTMDANDSTPPRGDSADGSTELKRSLELQHARGVVDAAADLLTWDAGTKRKADREQLLQRIREVRAELHVAEKILEECDEK